MDAGKIGVFARIPATGIPIGIHHSWSPRNHSTFFASISPVYNEWVFSSRREIESGTVMGIRFLCPNGHKLNVKSFLAGKRAICPDCGARVVVPSVPEQSVENSSTPPSSNIAASRTDAEWMESTSPSVVLTLAASEVAPENGAVDPLISADLSLPESIIAATTAHPAPVTVETKPKDVAAGLQRDRTRRNQMLVVLGLLMVVVVLAGVLIWVLKRSASPPPAAPAETTKITHAIQFVPSSTHNIEHFANALIKV